MKNTRQFFIVLIAMIITIPAFSMDSYTNDVIDISGSYESKRKTQADRLKKIRKKLEKQNELLVKKRIEQMRYKAELDMMKKVEKALNSQLNAIQ